MRDCTPVDSGSWVVGDLVNTKESFLEDPFQVLLGSE